jgi:hypothetical protein
MTEKGIVAKLRATLRRPVDTEAKVVYVLAECRKLLDTYPPNPAPITLKIYCHWALHVDLTNPGTTLPFLTRVDEYVASVLAGGGNIALEHQMLEEFVLMKTFRDQFRQFLKAENLPTSICDKDSRWHRFLKHYAGVIEDGSLSCSAKKANALKHVDEVTITKGKAASKGSYLPFEFKWEILLLDKRKMTVELQAGKWGGGGEGISNKISIK